MSTLIEFILMRTLIYEHHVIYEHYDFDKDPAPYLNRNGILHGRVPDYGTEPNSLRVFLFVDSVADRWLEEQKKKTP